MNTYGIFDTITQKFIYTYTNTRQKEFGTKFDGLLHIDITGKYPEGYSWDGSNLVYDESYSPDVIKDYALYNYVNKKRRGRNSPYTNKTIPPLDINYKTELALGLYPNRTFVQGELQEVIWYGTYDALETDEADRWKDPVLKVSVVYNRDALGFAQFRITTRSWYFVDGELDEVNTKISNKYYNHFSTIKEGKTRRKNIIDQLSLPVLSMLAATELVKDPLVYTSEAELIVEGRRFMSSHKQEINNFIDDSNTQLAIDVTADATVWLDNIIDGNGTTIRMYLLNEIDIQDVV